MPLRHEGSGRKGCAVHLKPLAIPPVAGTSDDASTLRSDISKRRGNIITGYVKPEVLVSADWVPEHHQDKGYASLRWTRTCF